MAARRRTVAEKPAPNAGARPNPAPPPIPEPDTLQPLRGYYAVRPPPRPIPTVEERVSQIERDLAQLRADFAAAVEVLIEAFGDSH